MNYRVVRYAFNNDKLRKKIARSRPLLSRQRLSTGASDDASPLRYDRDTGIVWEEMSASSRPLYQTIIGIEIHAQLAIPTKLFSSAPTRHNAAFNDAAANTLIHAYDIAYPGTLPSLSLPAVKACILSAAALNCKIHNCSRFERKHYFYPDLPPGYQITQQRWPLASEGLVTFLPYYNKQVKPKEGNIKKRRRRGVVQSQDMGNDEPIDKKQNEFEPQPVQLRIERIQLEQDTGKTTTHNITNGSGQTITKSYIDYNRAGCALIEIVSHPDLRTAHEAAGVIEQIRKLLKYVGSCDGKMEEGSLRCDLNVSIAPIKNDEQLSNYCMRGKLPPNTGQRVEVKNLNSLRQIIAATEYEALRQASLSRNNTPTGRETRTFHVKPISDLYPLGGETFCIRAKGDAIDYRFMPEPDLPPLVLDVETLGCNKTLEEFVEAYLPESPESAKARLMDDHGLTEDVANVISEDPPAIALFEQTVQTARNELLSLENTESNTAELLPTLAANWLCNDLFALVKKSAAAKGEGKIDNDEGQLSNHISVECSTVDGKRLGVLVAMVASGTLTSSMAKKILTVMYEDDLHSCPNDIAEANGWRVISDMDALIDICESVVLNPKNALQLEQYKLGGKKVWKIEKFFMGKIMAASKGNAHPELTKEALARVMEKLNSD